MNFYSDSTVVMPPNAPAFTGCDAVRQLEQRPVDRNRGDGAIGRGCDRELRARHEIADRVDACAGRLLVIVDFEPPTMMQSFVD